jgi:hypothetical protein
MQRHWTRRLYTGRSRHCGDLFIRFGGPVHKRFQDPVVCCVLPPPNSGMLLAIMYIKPVHIGSYRDQTSLLFYSHYHVGPGEILFVKLSSSTFSCTVFLCNVFELDGYKKVGSRAAGVIYDSRATNWKKGRLSVRAPLPPAALLLVTWESYMVPSHPAYTIHCHKQVEAFTS